MDAQHVQHRGATRRHQRAWGVPRVTMPAVTIPSTLDYQPPQPRPERPALALWSVALSSLATAGTIVASDYPNVLRLWQSIMLGSASAALAFVGIGLGIAGYRAGRYRGWALFGVGAGVLPFAIVLALDYLYW